MAVLGHDLRNPLAAIGAGTRLLAKTQLDDKAVSLVAMMEKSVFRMSSLIEDVTDLARSRLGGKIVLAPSRESLEPLLRQVVEEMRAMYPERVIEAEFSITKPVLADHHRIARLLSNLLGNALTYSPADSPVRVRAQTYGSFSLSVANSGPAIPPAMLDRLFVPFVRGHDAGNPQGLGLGLFIVSEIASAHGGTIDVTSTDGDTRFTFQMPLIADEKARPAAGL